MNDLFHRVKPYVDYNNTYGLRKILNTLNGEFDLALKRKKMFHAALILNTVKALHEDFGKHFVEGADKKETMNYGQKVLINKIRSLIVYLSQKLHKEQGLSGNYQKDIENAIKM